MERTESNLISDSLHVTYIIQGPVVHKVDSAINSYPGDNGIASYYLSAG